MKTIKVLHVSSGNLYGGVEQTLVTLVRERDCVPELARRFALCFAGRASEEIGAFGEPCTILGDVRVRYPWQILKVRARLAELLRREPVDVVICHMPWNYALFGPVARRAGVPAVLWLHDAGTGQHWLERWAALHPPDLVVCNSRFTAETLPKVFPGPRTPPHVVIHPPVSPGAILLAPDERAAVRAEFDTSPSACVIVQVSRMEPYKGHRLHLDALARLKDVPGWVYWVVGGVQRVHEREYLEQLREQAARAGIADRVRFLGERRDVRRVLAAADIFCQPNVRGEPYGVVFIEALQAGLPVVATALGGALEIVDATCGQLVPSADPVALAEGLRELITDANARTRLGRAGPPRAETLSAPQLILSQLYSALAERIAGLSDLPLSPSLPS